MSTEKFVSHKVFMSWEYEEEERYLNEMSEKGWQATKGGCFHTCFEKASDKAYCYRLDYNPKAMEDPEEKERYIETFGDDGWEFMNHTYNGWIYLRKERKDGMREEEFEIYSDRASLAELFGRLDRLLKICCFLSVIGFCLEISLFIGSGDWFLLGFGALLFCFLVWLLRGMSRLKEIRRRLLKKE